MSKKRSDVDEEMFSRTVQALVAKLRVGKKSDLWTSAADDERRIAACLVHIEKALMQARLPNTPEGEALRRDADSLVEALIDGDDDPVWFHIRGLQKRHRGRPPLTFAERYRRVTILGYVEVLRRFSKQPFVDAETAMRDAGLKITAGMMKAWLQRADPELQQAVAEWAADLEKHAAQAQEDPRDAGLRFVKINWSNRIEYPGVSEASIT